jgi:hypothetical protein
MVGLVIQADTSDSVAILNEGTIYLNPLVLKPGSNPVTGLITGDPSKPSSYSSAYSTLSVIGILTQGSTGVTVLTISSEYTGVPFISMSTNITYSGSVYVHVANDTTMSLPSYGGKYVSNWTLLSFAQLNSSLDEDVTPVKIQTIPGLKLTPTYALGGLVNLTVGATSTDSSSSASDSVSATSHQELLMVTNLACADIFTYYDGVSSSSVNYCSVCSKNSSCDFCGGTSCVDKGRKHDISNFIVPTQVFQTRCEYVCRYLPRYGMGYVLRRRLLRRLRIVQRRLRM